MDNTKIRSLSNDILFGSFLKTILVKEEIMSKKTPEEQIVFYQNLANLLTTTIDMPRINIVLNKGYLKFPETNRLGAIVYKEDRATMAASDIYKANSIEFPKPRFNKDLFNFRKFSTVLYHELRHEEQIFSALTNYFYNGGKPESIASRKTDPSVLKKAMNRLIPQNRKAFSELMMKKYLYTYNSDQKRIPYFRQVIERDGYNFSQEAYLMLNRDGKIKPTKDSDIRWNREAFNSVKDNSKYADPENSGKYVDTYAGNFSSRISNLLTYDELEIACNKIKF